jgi:F420-0:gamma-glutamyl ligase
MKYEFIPIKTRVVNPPKDEIWDILDGLAIKDGDIVFITSKILSIHQGRCVPKDSIAKEELIKQNAAYYLPYENKGGFYVNLTITDNILIPSAGIDESNANGHFIMWPKNSDKLCKEIRTRLVKKRRIKNLGVVATDSHTMPLRWGVTGISIGLSGIEPLEDARGSKDIFGRETYVTQIDKIDPLASVAVALMGETNEQTPIVILRGCPNLVFNADADMSSFKIPPETDIYSPLLEVMKNGKE